MIVTGGNTGIGKETAKVILHLLVLVERDIHSDNTTGSAQPQCKSLHCFQERTEGRGSYQGIEERDGEGCAFHKAGPGGFEVGQGRS